MSLLNFFRRSDYTSDTTQFIDQLKANKPTLEAEQRAGRALLWDKNLSRAEQAEYGEAKCPSSLTSTAPAATRTENKSQIGIQPLQDERKQLYFL
jgi:hypothetical protein